MHCKILINRINLIIPGEALSYASTLPQLGGSPYSTAPLTTSLSMTPVIVAGKQTEGEIKHESQITDIHLNQSLSIPFRSRRVQPLYLPPASRVHRHGPGNDIRSIREHHLGQSVYRQTNESVQVLRIRLLR